MENVCELKNIKTFFFISALIMSITLVFLQAVHNIVSVVLAIIAVYLTFNVAFLLHRNVLYSVCMYRVVAIQPFGCSTVIKVIHSFPYTLAASSGPSVFVVVFYRTLSYRSCVNNLLMTTASDEASRRSPRRRWSAAVQTLTLRVVVVAGNVNTRIVNNKTTTRSSYLRRRRRLCSCVNRFCQLGFFGSCEQISF